MPTVGSPLLLIPPLNYYSLTPAFAFPRAPSIWIGHFGTHIPKRDENIYIYIKLYLGLCYIYFGKNQVLLQLFDLPLHRLNRRLFLFEGTVITQLNYIVTIITLIKCASIEFICLITSSLVKWSKPIIFNSVIMFWIYIIKVTQRTHSPGISAQPRMDAADSRDSHALAHVNQYSTHTYWSSPHSNRSQRTLHIWSDHRPATFSSNCHIVQLSMILW